MMALYKIKKGLIIIAASLCVGYILYLFVVRVVPISGHTATRVPICQGCNVVLIAIDPFRADGLHVLGNQRTITPTLDRLARQGYLFTNAFAVSSWTLPSAMSLMTGTYPSQHKIINKELIGQTEQQGIVPARLADTNPGMETLASILKSHGYVTGGFAGGAALDPSYGFDRGFDRYVSDGDFEGLQTTQPKALDFIRSHVHDRLFIFLHGFDVHGQYIPPEGLTKKYIPPGYNGMLTGSKDEQKALREEGVKQQSIHLTPLDVGFLRGIYDEKVERVDAQIAEFLAAYKALHVKNKTVFIFTSDHGDEFYEHGRIDHGMTLFDEVIHVPLIIVVPGVSPGYRVTDQVRNIDIMPTILSLVGLVPSPEGKRQMEGVSIIPSMQGEHQRLDLFAETSYRYATFERAVRTWDGWKLIYDQNASTDHIFNLKRDPAELSDLIWKNNAKEQELMTKLFLWTDMIEKSVTGRNGRP